MKFQTLVLQKSLRKKRSLAWDDKRATYFILMLLQPWLLVHLFLLIAHQMNEKLKKQKGSCRINGIILQYYHLMIMCEWYDATVKSSWQRKEKNIIALKYPTTHRSPSMKKMLACMSYDVTCMWMTTSKYKFAIRWNNLSTSLSTNTYMI